LEDLVVTVLGSTRKVVQDVVRCLVFDELSRAETSEKLNISRRAVAYAMWSAREKLSEEVRWAWPVDFLVGRTVY